MKKGFTLIELLAVIVILAIIALIATPIVLSIINDTKESATLRSVEYYLEGVEQSIAKKSMSIGSAYSPSVCIVQEDGNLLCDGKDELVVEVKGEKPSSGKLAFEEGKIGNILITLGNDTVTKNDKNELTHFENEYEIGQEVTFNPGDEDRTWNVIDEDGTAVTLMLTENLGDVVAWYSSPDNNYGPVTALNYLNTLTTNWTNVDPIKNYSYINNLNGTQKPNGYQKLEIKDGKTKLTHKDGNTITEVEGVNKTRLLTVEEVFEIASKTNPNLKEENLIAYLERNLSAINTKLGTSFTKTDEVISLIVSSEAWLEYESRYIQIYYTVFFLVYGFEIEGIGDIFLPNYMYQYLSEDAVPNGYLLFSTGNSTSYDVWSVTSFGIPDIDSISIVWYGIRPVITIPKSKLQI